MACVGLTIKKMCNQSMFFKNMGLDGVPFNLRYININKDT